ncbi:MAG: hypothetical protein WDK96_03275 [Candidatus Paceibacterota bacterium]|jgi:hypothetical protein
MKELILKAKKILAITGKIVSIIILSIGSLLVLGFIGLAIYVVVINTHGGIIDIPDVDRRFLLILMNISAMIFLMGTSGFVWMDSILKKIPAIK